jgi:hypothetical protein
MSFLIAKIPIDIEINHVIDDCLQIINQFKTTGDDV